MKILLVRLRLIGDVVFTTPVIRAVRRRYPQAHLSYLVEPAAAPIVTGNPHLDEVIVAPKPRGIARLAADLQLARQLRRAQYDIAIDLHGGPRSGWLTWASGATRRIGYDIKGRGWMYTSRVARAPDLRPRHSVRNQWDLLTPLGITPPDPATDAVEMGDDAAAGFLTWHRYEEVALRSSLVVVDRPGAPVELPQGFEWLHVEVPRLDVSSTDLRTRVVDGRPLDYLVTDAVLEVIRERGLYRELDE